MRPTSYEEFEISSPRAKQLLRQEELLFDAQEEISMAMEKEGVTRAALAEMLGKGRASITRILSSGRNLTLRTWADVATALGYRVVPRMVKDGPGAATSITADSKASLALVGGRLSTRFAGRDIQVAP